MGYYLIMKKLYLKLFFTMSCFASPVFSETLDIYTCDILNEITINTTTGKVSNGDIKSLAFKLDEKNMKITVDGFHDEYTLDYDVTHINKSDLSKEIIFSAKDNWSMGTASIEYYKGKFSYMTNLVGQSGNLVSNALIAKCHKF
jgi:hypothetical protein